MVDERITRREIESYKRQLLDQSVLVTADDAARVLAVTPRTVRNYVREGRISAYNASAGSKGLRILASELRDYVNSIKIDLANL